LFCISFFNVEDIKFIRQAKTEKKITALDIFAVINSPQIASVFLDIPKVASSDLASFIKTQTSKQIPFNPEQSSLFYRVNRIVGKDKETQKLKVISLVVPNKLINDTLDVIRANNLNVKGIYIASEAIGYLPIMQGRSKKDSYAILDIGHKRSFLNIYRRGVLEFVRSINVAGEHITSSLLRTLTIEDKKIIITAEDAEKLKKECGMPLDEEKEEMVGEIKKAYIQTMLKPTIDRIINELKRSLSYHSNFLGGEQIKHLYLTGGSSQLKNLDFYIKSNLVGVEVSALKPLKLLKGIDELSFTNQEILDSFEGRLSSALGVFIPALKRINIVPKNILIEQKLNVLLIASAILVVLLGAIFAGFYFLTFGQIYSYQRLLKKVKSDYNRLVPVEDAINRYNALKVKYKAKKSKISKTIGRQPNWGGIFKEFTNITPEGVVFKKLV